MQEKYDRIGVNYNATRRADPYLFEQLHNLLSPTHLGKYLDIGCGTGNYTVEFSKKGYTFTGIDPSIEMLEKANAKSTLVTWKNGKAEHIDLPSTGIDGIIASLTIHHWQDLEQAFCEIDRVLKPKGKMVLFTSTPKQMQGYWLCHYFPKMMEDSMNQMPTFDAIQSSLQNTYRISFYIVVNIVQNYISTLKLGMVFRHFRHYQIKKKYKQGWIR